jgi:hypothetical protein
MLIYRYPRLENKHLHVNNKKHQEHFYPLKAINMCCKPTISLKKKKKKKNGIRKTEKSYFAFIFFTKKLQSSILHPVRK